MDEKRASQFLQRDDYVSNHRERERERERGHWLQAPPLMLEFHTLSPVS
jgi:hypothetical protein